MVDYQGIDYEQYVDYIADQGFDTAPTYAALLAENKALATKLASTEMQLKAFNDWELMRQRDFNYFLQNAKLVHDDKCDYRFAKYTSPNSKITIRCKVRGHRDFCETPTLHLRGHGCPKCDAAKLQPSTFAVESAGRTANARDAPPPGNGVH